MGGNIEKYAPELEQGAALFPYLLSKCMRSRYAWAMERISESACTRVLEIGGYLTPLPSLETFGMTPHNVSLYVNVDLSAQHAAVEQIPAGVHNTGPSSFAATLPLTLAEFEPFLATHVQQPFDCVLGLGLGRVSREDASAFSAVIKSAQLVVLETPRCNKELEGIIDAEPLLSTAGLARAKEHTTDCKDDAETRALYHFTDGDGLPLGASCLEREIVVYRD